MSGFDSINYIFAGLFALFGLFMAILGISVLAAGPTNETEWTIGLLSVFAALFFFIGARQTFLSNRRKTLAEAYESARLQKVFKTPGTAENPKLSPVAPTADVDLTQPEVAVETAPKVYVRWTYSPRQWRIILKKLVEKTKREERYTAFWFPVFGAIIFWANAVWGFLVGLALGFVYIKFRAYFVQTKFALKANQQEAEIIISDSYLRVNSNFIHYADGHYYLKNLTRETDKTMGDLLLFNIGWTTSKGYPAEMDLWLPIPEGRADEAETVLSAFKAAQS